MPTGSAEHFPDRVSRLEMAGRLRSEVAPLLAAVVKVNEQLAWCDAAVERARWHWRASSPGSSSPCSATGRAALARGGEEGLEVLADDGVEEGLLRLAPAASGKRRAGRAMAALPGPDGLSGGVHPGCRGKDRAGAGSPGAAVDGVVR